MPELFKTYTSADTFKCPKCRKTYFPGSGLQYCSNDRNGWGCVKCITKQLQSAPSIPVEQEIEYSSLPANSKADLPDEW